ncbi:hypothetical protein [Salinimicrobium oceani]|uniref:TonB protein C-terminal n=1 Tax=Salinimicrobium oceani TaxID=2722702 RepID=A0ABX1CTQ0_9FLAO|nr:hypothetical protein [Salinimicrobium oceani]NJW51663.1 hypothetical protein [Salinimicrobium oceani]
MKNLKLLLVGLAMILCSATKAETGNNLINPDSVSVEIERILKDVKLAENKDLEITVFFSVSEDQKIQNVSVASADKEVSRYLQEKLESTQLPEKNWMKGKIYELTVVKRVS